MWIVTSIGAWSSGIKDYNSRLLTGKESSSHNVSSLHSGVGDAKTLNLDQNNANKDGTITNKNISEAYAAQAKQDVKDQKEKPIDNNSSEQPGKVSVSGDTQKRDSE